MGREARFVGDAGTCIDGCPGSTSHDVKTIAQDAAFSDQSTSSAT